MQLSVTTSLPTQSFAQGFALCGTAFHAINSQQTEVLADALICVDQHGSIASVTLPKDPDYAALRAHHAEQNTLFQLKPKQYLLPGLVDLHVHAPQWPQNGKALDLPLYDWLQQHTFPLEAKYEDLDFAQHVYTSLVDTLLANGTTTAMYFGTIHPEACLVLAQTCLRQGQRALIGKVAMDLSEQCPDFYRDASAQVSVEQTEALIQAIRNLPNNTHALVHPAITPRFIPTCSDAALTGLGELAQRYQCHVQTHCSESDWAHEHVKNRYGKNDAQALNDFGLLTRQTVLAHANFLSDVDMETIRKAGASIAHCPLSNFYFANSVFPLRRALNKKLHVGLGTDISGGYSPSMFDSCRYAIAASCALNEGVNPALSAAQRGRGDMPINFTDAFWLATRGGGEALNLPIGQFIPGFHFDAIVIDTTLADSNIQIWPELDNDRDALQKIIYNASRVNVSHTWVQGKLVHQR